jgi:hypothetical protein
MQKWKDLEIDWNWIENKMVIWKLVIQKLGCWNYSPFCVQAKIIKLVGLKNGGRLSEINLVIFAGTQNGE